VTRAMSLALLHATLSISDPETLDTNTSLQQSPLEFFKSDCLQKPQNNGLLGRQFFPFNPEHFAKTHAEVIR